MCLVGVTSKCSLKICNVYFIYFISFYLFLFNISFVVNDNSLSKNAFAIFVQFIILLKTVAEVTSYTFFKDTYNEMVPEDNRHPLICITIARMLSVLSTEMHRKYFSRFLACKYLIDSFSKY